MKKLSIVLVSLCLVGCVAVKYPQRQTYMLHVRMPLKAKHHVSDDTLEVVNFAVLSQYSTLGFVYRLSALNFIQDYYNIFFVSPSVQINHQLVSYLNHKRLFKPVTTTPGEINPDYLLYGKVTRLYADYRNRAKPTASIAINFVLVRPGKRKANMIFNVTYSANIPLMRKDSVSLVRAWSQGLGQICSRLSRKLQGIVSE